MRISIAFPNTGINAVKQSKAEEKNNLQDLLKFDSWSCFSVLSGVAKVITSNNPGTHQSMVSALDRPVFTTLRPPFHLLPGLDSIKVPCYSFVIDDVLHVVLVGGLRGF